MSLTLATIPDNIFREIIRNMDPSDALRLESVSKAMKEKTKKLLDRTPPVIVSTPSEIINFQLFIEDHPNLVSIDLSHSLYLTDELILELVTKCPKLESVNIWNCLYLHDDSLFHLSKLENLSWVCVGDNEHFTSKGLSEIVVKCPHLQHLDLSNCKNVDTSLAEAIAEHGENLTELLAEFCDGFATNASMAILSKGKCLKLEKLILGNGFITDAGIESITHSTFRAALKAVDLRRNTEVSQIGYDLLHMELQLEELDGISANQLPESDVGSFFMVKRQMMGDG
ncbi:putative Leucine Rich repeat containing protein [Monocercomonoides exilis]|uniref:putative Leucine Rich repeat containing protein n=1 Tax=Monocercomonoides exilis TaxID=2049356 RepID=UPI0035595178|nr:putative Leucine Rich repeat containing protein [Monocercomonoides exilis]|eukprot:MONOS_10238.1-p1 / transcript=MONOS_10238.1 / gene=MONOS_10238 / organism=Monocercomonoides_exilis_PA203 / gene_product=Leucine Rich repeat containing protein / transcript_product=Leucine Rich repeat containing protein / location=Mono_scaffold00457:23279-24281(+) / protein_length=284 / sequence_SO=supercontig / SO=protein_coding / is_pseudo=false